MITVIVPIYNTEKYLPKCLDSILNQTYTDIELILVDDGSTDFSPEICKEYAKKDNRIKYYRIDNGGQGRARNFGLDRAKGEWITFVDSDDYIEKDMYEEMIALAEDNDADIAICGWRKNHGFKQFEKSIIEGIKIYNTIELLREYFSTDIIAPMVWNKIYRSYLWDNIRFPQINSKEDTAIMYKILEKAKKAVHIGKAKYTQLIRVGSTERRKFSKDKLIAAKFGKERKEYIEKKYPELKDDISLEPAKQTLKLMKEIIFTLSMKQYKKEYNELYKDLCYYMSLEYSEQVKKSEQYSNLKNIINNYNGFLLKSYISGIERCIVDLMSTIYLKIKNPYKLDKNMYFNGKVG